jgi:large subunit ribosomal protein L28
MSRKCDVCGKGVQTGFNVSHSHLKTKKKWKPNIQKVKVAKNGRVEMKKVCTRCLRSAKINKPSTAPRKKISA